MSNIYKPIYHYSMINKIYIWISLNSPLLNQANAYLTIIYYLYWNDIKCLCIDTDHFFKTKTLCNMTSFFIHRWINNKEKSSNGKGPCMANSWCRSTEVWYQGGGLIISPISCCSWWGGWSSDDAEKASYNDSFVWHFITLTSSSLFNKLESFIKDCNSNSYREIFADRTSHVFWKGH